MDSCKCKEPSKVLRCETCGLPIKPKKELPEKWYVDPSNEEFNVHRQVIAIMNKQDEIIDYFKEN